MKILKILNLLAVAGAALMAFAGAASADTATAPAGVTYTGVVTAEDEISTVSLHGSNGVTIECHSHVEGKIEVHGVGKTVEGNISKLSFLNCSPGNVVHVNKNGRLIAHTEPGGHANLTVSNAEFTMTVASIFGTITCIYATGTNLPIGTITAAPSSTGHATLDISATIPRIGGSGLCGNSGVWTGNYKFNTPTGLRFS